MQYGFTIVYVPDVPLTVEFYRKAFGFKTRFLHPSQEYAELATGMTRLAFASHRLAKDNLPDGFRPISLRDQQPCGIEIAFMADDVPAAMQQAIDAGATLLVDAVVKPWGQTVGYVRDINGMLIEICSPIQTADSL